MNLSQEPELAPVEKITAIYIHDPDNHHIERANYPHK
jgi:hypothetical protein